MSRFMETVLITSILALGMLGVMAVAENSYERIDIICQEGC